eukprot:692583-Rhodomonas_salina.2
MTSTLHQNPNKIGNLGQTQQLTVVRVLHSNQRIAENTGNARSLADEQCTEHHRLCSLLNACDWA